MSKNERLFDFQTITKTKVQLLFSTFSPNIIVTEFVPMSGGMSTSNYIVETEGNTNKYVLRIYPVSNDHCQLEGAAYNYAKKLISVPDIYFFDCSKQIIPNSYLIMEYIEGLPLRDFIALNKDFPNNIVYNISSALALLHQKEYPYMALLDEHLYTTKKLEPFESQYFSLLDNFAGTHIKPSTKERAFNFFQNNSKLVETVASKYVLSHGDFIFSNVIITPTLQTYFIDFEYCFSAPLFYDIGKFFRTKSLQVQEHITLDRITAFYKGYNLNATEPLPQEWYALSKLADISSMLHLINKPNIPEGWGDDIDDEIVKTLKLFL